MSTTRTVVALAIPQNAAHPARLVALDDTTFGGFRRNLHALLGGPLADTTFHDRTARAYSNEGLEGSLNEDATVYLELGRKLRLPSIHRGPVIVAGASEQERLFTGDVLPALLPDISHPDVPIT